MSSSVIRLLPDHVANQIAAGEVVQRPASVVKELLENAVDADATSIKLIIKDAGKTLIQVIDNGKGMNELDARMCFERHATSKIQNADDLFRLNTKGFRGEALASIAAIAQVDLKTKPHDVELGTHIIIEGSQVISQEVAVLPGGTVFAVKNLFYNIPARRNFLKSDQVELRHVVDEFERVALTHPDIEFSMLHNGNELFVLPASNLRQRIVNVFGSRTNEKLVPVTETTEIVTVDGFVGKPEFAKKTRGEQFFFVNNRYIKSSYLNHAITAAYEGLLKEGTHPSYFLYLKVPPGSIDINIHPTKTEIKFDDEQALYAILRATVKHSLGQFQIAPALDFQRDASLDTPYGMEGKDSETPTIEIDTQYNPFQNYPSEPVFSSKMPGNSTSASPGTNRDMSRFAPTFGSKSNHSHWDTLYTGLPEETKIIVEQAGKQAELPALFDEAGDGETHSYRTYQIHKKYIVSPVKSGMVIIDQRRAHQRILYERYQNAFCTEYNASQQLLFPLTLYYTALEMSFIVQLKGHLEKIGFVFDVLDQEKVTISGLPVQILESEVSIIIDDFLLEWQNGVPSDTDIIQEKLAKSMAQSLSVKTGTTLTDKEQEDLVNNLFACNEPNISPFMKPTFMIMKVEDIDKKFML